MYFENPVSTSNRGKMLYGIAVILDVIGKTRREDT
jgi:hypothetical protein